jgi:hypothetical protein
MCRAVVRKPKVTLSINPETIDLDTMIVDIRNIVRNLYEAGTLPSGPIHADYRNGTIVIIDMETGVRVA